MDAGGALARGEQRASDLIDLARRSPLVEGPLAVEVLYLERLRLGMGSPFRLIEQALLDERLEPERRRRLGEALLAMTYQGRSYAIDPAGIAGPRGPREPDPGPDHLRLVSDAVAEASDPRVGEEAVRLAYLLAQAEGLSDPLLVRGLAHAAAMIRDRVTSQRDALALIREASGAGRDPLDLVREWRAERRFRVEAPLLDRLDPPSERLAITLAPRLHQAIRQLDSGDHRPAVRRALPASLLNAATASALTRALPPMPPQAPVAVAVGVAGRMYAGSYGVDPDSLSAELRLRMPDEERLALQQVVLLEHRPELRPVLARATLAAASALRAYGQEEVWRPGMPAPSTRELVAQFGLEDIVFDDDIPGESRRYYRRMIHSALLDLQRVLPALDVRGLRLVIGPVPSGAALALHSPGQRTIYLPPATGAGTIAHEIAHDLDWQVARKRYRVRGDYGSDIASRGGRRDRLAATYLGLTGAALVDAAAATIDRPHHTRPAEIFARSIDWLVAASLARNGRMNGYLTSIQDPLLTGYGTAVAPDVNGRVAAALINILDEVAPMRTETRSWYLSAYGLGRELSAVDLVRMIAEVPTATNPRSRDAEALPWPVSGSEAVLVESIGQLRATAADAMAVGVCRAPSHSLDPVGAGARADLIRAATRARARGLAREYAARALGPNGEAALVERLEQGPWSTPVDPAHAGLVRALVEAANDAVAVRPIERGGWFEPVVGPECG